MKRPQIFGRLLGLLAVVIPLAALFLFVALRSGPLAPVPVTVATVRVEAIAPARFGLGTVEARQVARIGPVAPGRLLRLAVDVGDHVRAGQVVAELDPVDLDERRAALEAALRRVTAQRGEAAARQAYVREQAERYGKLHAAGLVSEEQLSARRQDAGIGDAGLAAAREEESRLRAELAALAAQRRNLSLVAPSAGLVIARHADPGTAVVAGQAVLDVADPAALWIDARFDQSAGGGLRAGLPASVVLRSREDRPLPGTVLRLEPLADAVTEESLAKIGFVTPPAPLPPLGELAEVTVNLPALPPAPVLPDAAVHREGDVPGVWFLTADGIRFQPVTLGAADLDGRVQVLAGLKAGDRVVLHSARALKAGSRVTVIERIPGAPR
jgi:HlyD family secretion protein